MYSYRHKEVVIKGLCQLSKTPETICQAFFCFFAEGVLPNIMVRNRGGANVGTRDMYHAVLEMNEVYREKEERGGGDWEREGQGGREEESEIESVPVL